MGLGFMIVFARVFYFAKINGCLSGGADNIAQGFYRLLFSRLAGAVQIGQPETDMLEDVPK